jgi:transposase-like protein
MATKKDKTIEEELANALITKYQPKTVEDMEDALKSVFGPMFESMLKGEMTNHLGFDSNDHKTTKATSNRRNGYIEKDVKTKSGKVKIKVPRDRDASFEPQLIEKRKSNVAAIEDKVINMYARGLSQRDIASTIQDIYGFTISAEMVSNITDAVLEEQQRWQERPLEAIYPFVFVDCTYISIKQEMGGAKKCAVYVVLAYNMEGAKEILGLWIGETEGAHVWMQIFDELKARGVQDILFLSSDGVSGMEEGSKSIFPNIIYQKCIVHLIRYSIKYIPSKHYKAYTKDLKQVYSAKTLKTAQIAFEKFKQTWIEYPGAVDTWVRNWKYVEQLFEYTADIRRIMYTTNIIESVNSSLKKAVKKGSFINADSALKLLYLRVKELDKKWATGHMRNWSAVRNQLYIIPKIKERIDNFN